MGMNDRTDKRNAPKTPKNTPKGGGKAEWIGFVNLELTPEQKAQCKSLLSDVDSAYADVFGRIPLGYKLSVMYDDAHTTWNVSLTCTDASEENAGLCLTGRGGSFNSALVALWYRDVYLLKGKWTAAEKIGLGRMGEDDVG